MNFKCLPVLRLAFSSSSSSTNGRVKREYKKRQQIILSSHLHLRKRRNFFFLMHTRSIYTRCFESLTFDYRAQVAKCARHKSYENNISTHTQTQRALTFCNILSIIPTAFVRHWFTRKTHARSKVFTLAVSLEYSVKCCFSPLFVF